MQIASICVPLLQYDVLLPLVQL